jgi:hypothetical protein
METEGGKSGADRARDEQANDSERPAETGEEALNDARALQQMIEGVPDSDEEFRRIEQKRGQRSREDE